MGAVLLIVLLVIALLVLGWIVVGLTIKLLWWALVGLLIGGLARLVLPGEQRIGLLATGLFGIAGSLTGGIVADAIGVGSVLQFLIAIALAALFIALWEGGLRERFA